ncbi:hypothetical protein C8Q80DRAFT_159767 [Daedaleopsis nitida]|nr:hypothetical protein C8Q80DRAFT_159767 [Daedaleopsis nitida]
MCGQLGKLLKEGRTHGGTSWRYIALVCIRVDGFCTPSQCGESLLENNRQRMQVAAAHVKSTN